MSAEIIEAERANCKAAGGGILECSAHLVEWRLRRKWLGAIVAGGGLVLALVADNLDRFVWR
jgi:hypothetical protein